MIHIKDTRIAKYFSVGLYSFIWTIICFVFIAGGTFYLMRDDITNNTVYGQETRRQLNEHKTNEIVHLSTNTAVDDANLINQVQTLSDILHRVDPIATEDHVRVAVLEAKYDNIEKGIFDINRKLNILIDNKKGN